MDGGNGTLNAEVNGKPVNTASKISEGTTVKFTAAPNSGYEVETWTVIGATFTKGGTNGSTTAELNVGTADITVKVKFNAKLDAKYRGTWRIESWEGRDVKKGYFLNIDDKDVLRVASSESKNGSNLNTTPASVRYTIDEKNKTIEIYELRIRPAAKFELSDSDKTMTITLADSKKVVFKKFNFSSTPNFAADSMFGMADTFIYGHFNSGDNSLFKINPFNNNSEESGKVWQVKKIEGVDVSAKKLYVLISGSSSITLACR